MAETNKSPLAWILIGDKAGDAAQMRSLAQAAGLRYVEKKLQFNELRRRPNILLGASLRSIDQTSRTGLAPPWPDIVLSSGKRSVPVARWIKRQSAGRSKLVHVGRPWGRLAWFDLVLAMPQYGLPDRANVFQARMPFNRPSAQALARAAEEWRTRFAHLPRPWIGLLVGGSAKPLVLDAARAAEIGRAVSQRARALNGSVLAVTSRRTGSEASAAVLAAIEEPALRHGWSASEPANPYLAILALADELVVTGDSASMLAEAVQGGKPVSIAPLPKRPNRKRRRTDALRRILPPKLFDWLVDLGALTAIRDVERLHRALLADGRASMLGDQVRSVVRPDDDLSLAAARLRQLLGRPL